MALLLDIDPRRRIKRRRIYFAIGGGRVLERIELTQAPTGAQYTDTAIDFTGLIITAQYSDGQSEVVQAVPDKIVWGSEATEQTVVFSYQGKTCEWSTTPTLRVLVSIGVETMPTKTVYLISGELDTAGLTIRKTYNSGNSEVISSGFTCSPTTFSVTGTVTITVSYTEGGVTETTSFNVTVNALSPVSLIVSGNWSNAQYAGSAVDTTGLVFTVVYDDESEAAVIPNVSPNTWAEAGEQVATFSYTENGVTVTATKAATVLAVVPVSLSIYGSWTNTQYVSMAVDYTGLLFAVTYNNGVQATVSPTDVNPSVWGNTPGMQTVTFSYTESGVTVSASESVNVSDMPIVYDVLKLINRSITEVNA